MKKFLSIPLASLLILVIALSACNNKPHSHDHENAATLMAEGGAHEADEHGEAEGEESGTQYGLDEVYDEQRSGTHLVLAYDEEARAFKGTVENISNALLSRVRVDVHLSSGTELGPTIQADMQPGEKRDVELAVESDDFTSWSTHAEVGEGKNSHESEAGHSHEGGDAHIHN